MVKSNVSFEYGTHLLKNQICNAPFPVFFFAWLRNNVPEAIGSDNQTDRECYLYSSRMNNDCLVSTV